MATITVYFAEVCGLCHKTMDWMRDNDIPFEAKEIIYDKEADAFVDSENTREMYARVGSEVDFVPQIFINERHIPGYRKLEPMIESGEIFDILKAEGIGKEPAEDG